jgi:predicted N-acetyltransferase YhbS
VLDGDVAGRGGLSVRSGRQRHAADLGLAVCTRLQGQGIGTALLKRCSTSPTAGSACAAPSSPY